MSGRIDDPAARRSISRFFESAVNGLPMSVAVEEWRAEAGRKYFDETVEGVRNAVAQTADSVKGRDGTPYSTQGK